MGVRKDSILQEIINRIKTISTANGYLTNAGMNVFENRSVAIPEDCLPAINVFEGNDDFQQEVIAGVSQLHEYLLEVEIEITARGTDSAQNLRYLEADVKKAIHSNDETLNGLAIDIIPSDVMPIYDRQRNKKLIGKIITIGVKYRTNAWQSE